MSSLFRGLWRAMEINRTARTLYSLSDAQLKDIGIRRDQIGTHINSIFNTPTGR